MRDVIWTSLMTSIQSGQCILVLGPDIPVERAPISESAAFESAKLRDVFCHYLAEQLEEVDQKVSEMVLFAVAQQFNDSPALSTVNLKNIAAQFFRKPGYLPGPLYLGLAQCPFSIILTTCHDDLFDKALREQGKNPS